MRRKILAIVTMLVFALAGCMAEKRVSTPELLGAGDEALVSARGVGSEVSYEIDGERKLQQRSTGKNCSE